MKLPHLAAACAAFVCAIAGACQSMQPAVLPIERSESVDGRPLEQRPQVIAGSCQAPAMPVTMQQAGATGETTLNFVLDTTGVVEAGSITVTATTAPDLADPAKAAIATCRFSPGRIAGQAVRTRVVQRVKFEVP